MKIAKSTATVDRTCFNLPCEQCEQIVSLPPSLTLTKP